ncbi:MAG TPA: hypothetical protein VHV10_08400, partial [Ktedonobacteraceae bacterium]|nr:hypothetical protein [Ktedonobacteraceae bacterium]
AAMALEDDYETIISTTGKQRAIVRECQAIDGTIMLAYDLLQHVRAHLAGYDQQKDDTKKGIQLTLQPGWSVSFYIEHPGSSRGGCMDN